MSRTCQVRNLHLVTYENGMKLQQRLAELRQEDRLADQLLLLEHSPVITLGRGGSREHLLVPEGELRSRGVRFHETTRGGDITYHGPGQLVGYPILHLGEGRRDIRRYVTHLEEVLIRTVAHFGVTATRVEGKRGIWVGNDKIAAIGVRIARWVTSHGFALNIAPDLSHFQLITPCGLKGTGVTSLEVETGRSVSQQEVRRIIVDEFANVFDREMVEVPDTLKLIKIIVHHDDLVLLLHRRKERGDFWQPVTGTIETGETPLQTAMRELLEETGTTALIEPLHLIQSFLIDSMYLEQKFHGPVIASEIAFTASTEAGAPIRLDQEEHDDYGWFTLDEALRRVHWPDDREALEKFERSRTEWRRGNAAAEASVAG